MPGRRPLVAFVLLSAIPLPACLHVGAPTPPKEPAPKPTARAADAAQPPRMEFAVLPRVPGTVVHTNPQPQAKHVATQKPANTQPAAPPKTVEPVQPIGGAPGPLPHALMQPNPVAEPPLLAAVRAYAEGRPERAIEIIRALDKPNQDLVLALLPVLSRGATADMKDPATVALLVEQLRGVIGQLEPMAALKVERMVFCKDVSGFGRFVPWPDGQPYRPNGQVQLYLEVRNLVSQPAGDGFVTRVHAAVEVRDAHGRLVEQIDPDAWQRRVPVVRYQKELTSRSPLHDFHVLYIFSAPPAPGVYTITFELRDSTGRRVVKTPPARFDVAGP